MDDCSGHRTEEGEGRRLLYAGTMAFTHSLGWRRAVSAPKDSDRGALDLHGATSIRQLVARSGHSESSGQSSAYWDDYEGRLKALIQQRLESEEGE